MRWFHIKGYLVLCQLPVCYVVIRILTVLITFVILAHPVVWVRFFVCAQVSRGNLSAKKVLWFFNDVESSAAAQFGYITRKRALKKGWKTFMQRFKKILLPMQGHNKNELHWLYNTKQSPVDEEPPLIFDYLKLRFWFAGTGRRNSEKLLLYIRIPRELVFEKCSA